MRYCAHVSVQTGHSSSESDKTKSRKVKAAAASDVGSGEGDSGESSGVCGGAGRGAGTGCWLRRGQLTRVRGQLTMKLDQKSKVKVSRALAAARQQRTDPKTAALAFLELHLSPQ